MNYSPSEVCEKFDIAKSTLFRWEQEGKISPAPRKLSGEREYNKNRIKEIAKIKTGMLWREYKRAWQIGDEGDKERMRQIQEAISQIKALYLDDMTGLFELAQYNTISNKVIKELLIKASNLDPKERFFKGIVELLHLKLPVLGTTES